ncbi:endoglucanase [Podospora conica]|nr:endoglucanase [Schizothecium conicum]
MKPTLFLAASAAAVVHASALMPRQAHLQSLCDLYAYWSNDKYELLNNLWGKDTATSGSQCTYLDGTANDGMQWSTTWTWNGSPDSVKSYPYAGRKVAKGRTIASIRTMPTSVTWKYDRTDIRANVAYDVFTAKDAYRDNTAGDYELMIWLARYGGIYPIGQLFGQVNLAGRTWDLWTGYNGKMRVYSFLPPSGDIRDFSCDVKDFYNYLEEKHAFPAKEQNVIVYQIGTEAFTGGPATFTATKFNAEYS